MEEAYACSLGSSSACSHMSSQAAAAPPPSSDCGTIINWTETSAQQAQPLPHGRSAEQMNSLQGR